MQPRRQTCSGKFASVARSRHALRYVASVKSKLDSVPERFLQSEQIAFFSVVLRKTVAEQMVVVPTTKSRVSQQPPN